MIDRRGLLTGLGALIAAPAIVRATSLMPVRRPPLLIYDRVWLRDVLVPELPLAFGQNMLLIDWARDEVMRITAIPPEQFYRLD